MSELIEWGMKYLLEHGYTGGFSVAYISTNGTSNKPYKLFFLGKEQGVFESREEAKAKAEELLAAWLKEAGLIVKPVKCDKCGDKGEDWKMSKHLGFPMYKGPCPCTKDPHSLFNFIKNGE